MTAPLTLDNVRVTTKANVYFDGKVVSHSVLSPSGLKQTVGIIFPGTFHFNTGDPEKMEILAGEAQIKLAGESQWKTVGAGQSFQVAGKSSFDIQVNQGLAEYLCTFLPS